MRKPHRSLVLGVIMLLALCGAPAFARAAEDYERSYGDNVMHKLGRGIANIFTGPLEIVRVSSQVSSREGYFAGWTSGVLRGVLRAVVRDVVGVFEVLTCYTSAPNGFKPIIKPEFVFMNAGWAPDEQPY